MSSIYFILHSTRKISEIRLPEKQASRNYIANLAEIPHHQCNMVLRAFRLALYGALFMLAGVSISDGRRHKFKLTLNILLIQQ